MQKRSVLRPIAMIVLFILVFGGAMAGATLWDISTRIQKNTTPIIVKGKVKESTDLVDPNAGKTINVLILGQDTRDGASNAAIGGSDMADEHQSDTAMVMQISADRSYINLVSIPRDSLVDAPACKTPNGEIPVQYKVMFNSIFSTAWHRGGGLSAAASCTLDAVNALTGLTIDNFIVVDFHGLQNMIDAIGGVDVCLPSDTKDAYTSLDLKKGLQHLDGLTATQYARMRHGTGTDGTDVMRTTRQQYLIKQLLDTAMQKNLLTQTSQLYQLGRTALDSLNISPGLADATTLGGLAFSLRNIRMDHVYAQTIPVKEAPSDPNRRVWASSAYQVWNRLQAGQPLSTMSTDTPASTTDPSPSDAASTSASTTDASAPPSPSNTTDDPSSDTSSSASSSTVDPRTGVITSSDGKLIDPTTHGVIDPSTGYIKDPSTGEYIGVAQQYLNVTVCGLTR
jgi:LCP family protein required for cell wall assembly